LRGVRITQTPYIINVQKNCTVIAAMRCMKSLYEQYTANREEQKYNKY